MSVPITVRVSREHKIAAVLSVAFSVFAIAWRMPVLVGVADQSDPVLTATAEITAQHPGIGVLVLSMLDQQESVLAAIRAGARGYVLKDTDAEDLVRAIQAAAGGEAVFGASIASGLPAFVGGRRTPPPEALPDLNPSERSVLRLIAQGHDNRQISQRLPLSEKTVRNYVSKVFRKLGVADRAQAIVQPGRPGCTTPRRGAVGQLGVSAQRMVPVARLPIARTVVRSETGR